MQLASLVFGVLLSLPLGHAAPSGVDSIGCYDNTIVKPGFIGRVQTYTYGRIPNFVFDDEKEQFCSDFFDKHFQKGATFLEEVQDVTSVNFNSPDANKIYGVGVNDAASAVLSGWLYAPMDGYYEFQISTLSVVQIAIDYYSCCRGSSSGFTRKSCFRSTNGSNKMTVRQYFRGGVYHSISLIYVRTEKAGNVGISVKLPNNMQVDDIGSMVYQIKQEKQACAPETKTWFGTYTTTVTKSGANGWATPQVNVPLPATTTTKIGSLTYTTTRTHTGADGTNTVEVWVPRRPAPATTFSSSGSTASSVVTTKAPETVTTTKLGSYSYTTTKTVTGSHGTNTVEVLTPYATTTMTTSGSYTQIAYTTITGTDGTVTVEVQVPITSSQYSSSTRVSSSTSVTSSSFSSSALASSSFSSSALASSSFSSSALASSSPSSSAVASSSSSSSALASSFQPIPTSSSLQTSVTQSDSTLITVVTTTSAMTSTAHNGNTTVLTSTFTYCPECESNVTEIQTVPILTTTETATVVVTSTNDAGETVILTETFTTTYCPEPESSKAGHTLSEISTSLALSNSVGNTGSVADEVTSSICATCTGSGNGSEAESGPEAEGETNSNSKPAFAPGSKPTFTLDSPAYPPQSEPVSEPASTFDYKPTSSYESGNGFISASGEDFTTITEKVHKTGSKIALSSVSGNGFISASGSVYGKGSSSALPTADVSTYDGSGSAMGMISSLAILPLFALLI